MPQYKAPLRDMRFLLNEVFDYPAHYASLPAARAVVIGTGTNDLLEGRTPL